MKKNKEKQEEFLRLNKNGKLNYLNKIVEEGGTTNIDKRCGFSYSWVSDKLEEEGIFYVSKIKRFIVDANSVVVEEKEQEILSKEEVIFIKKLYKEKELCNEDIRLVVGTCKKAINKTIPIDEDINKKWNEFIKTLNGVSVKDLYSSALKEFINKYKK